MTRSARIAALFRSAALFFAVAGAAAPASAARLDLVADAVLGQANLAANGPNQPDGVPSARNLLLSNAAHLAVAPDGRLYVADADNNRVLSWPSAQGFRNEAAADLVLGQPDFTSAAPNNGGLNATSLWLPQGLCVDSSGALWVCDAFNHRVLKFLNPAATDRIADMVIGQPDFTHGEANLGRGEQTLHSASADSIYFPGRIVVRGTDVFVADSGNSRVLHYASPAGNQPAADRVWGQYGDFTCLAKSNDGACNDFGAPTADNLFNPIGIALDAAGRLYVADWINHRVLRFDDPLTSDTTADAVIGQADFASGAENRGAGPARDSLSLPIDLSFDSHGRLFIADSGNNRVVVYRDPSSDTTQAARVFGQLRSFTSNQPNHGLGPSPADASGFFGPSGTAFDSRGDLLVADTNNNRVLRFNFQAVGSGFRRN